MKNTLELRDSIHQMVLECRSMVEVCKKEQRNMTEEEDTKFNELKEEIEQKKRELQELEDELKNYEDELPEDLNDKEVKSEEEEIKEEKNNRNYAMKNTFLVKELRNALDKNIKTITVNAETRAMQVTGEGGLHDTVVETEIEGILEPLYAKSVLAQLGVKFYQGLPKGDVQIPIMGKGNVGWAGEIAAATASSNSMTTVKLTPKRLTAYVDISKQLIYQDTIGVEKAIRADIVNAIADKLEATILGDGERTDNQPAGIFNGKEINGANTFAALTKLEAKVEANNVYGEMKYLLSPTAKADLRAMAKSTKNTQLVYEGGEVDGVPALTTSNVAENKFIYGNFANLAVGSWGDIEITVDEYTQATNGCIRLVVNAFFDAAILRNEAFVFGTTQA